MSIDRSASQHDASQTLSVPVVEAQQIVLRDSAGNVRAQLGVGPDDEAQLRFWNAAGKNRVAVGVCQVPGLWLFDDDGRRRVELSLADDSDTVGLNVMDQTGTVRMSMNFRDGTTQLEMFDANERQRVAVGCGHCGEGMFAVFDVHENVKVGLLSSDGDPGTIHLAQAAGNVVAGLQITDQGHFRCHDGPSRRRFFGPGRQNTSRVPKVRLCADGLGSGSHKLTCRCGPIYSSL